MDGGFVASYSITVTPKPFVTYSGFYNIVSVFSSKGIEVVNSSISSKANVQQMTLTDESDNQLWQIEHVENNVYLIRAKHSGMCLSTGADGQWGGKNVEQQTCNNSNSQKWRIDSVAPDIYKILNVGNSEAMDVQDVSMADGANIQTWTFEGNDHSNQLWELKKIIGTGTNSTPFSDQFISLYPNPVDDQFVLEHNSGAAITGCQIINAHGLVVTTASNNSSKMFVEASSLGRGVYFVVVQGEEGNRTIQFVKR